MKTNNFRILAADDDQPILDLFKKILCPTRDIDGPSSLTPSFDLELCKQAQEAVDALRVAIEEDTHFAVAFLDIHLPPGPDGLWAAEQIRKVDPDINIVLITDHSDPDLEEIGPRILPPDKLLYLRKPFNPQEIWQTASSLCAKWQVEKELRETEEQLEAIVEKRTSELMEANRRLETQIEKSGRADNRLLASEEKFRSMINTNADGIIILDQKGIVRFMNPAAELIFGRKAESLIGESFGYPVIADETAELDITCGEGKVLVVEMRVVKTEWEGDQAKIASIRDISDRKRAEEAIRDAAEEWRQCFDAIEGMMLLTDTDFNVQRVNKAAARILGRDISKILGQPCYRLIHGTETPPDSCPKLKAMITGKPEYAEMKETHLGRILGISDSPMKDNQGRVVRTVEVIDDITIRKQNEQESIRLTEALAKSFMSTTEAISDLTEKRDPYTIGHSKGVTELSVSIAQKMGMEEEEIKGLQVCAMLHDVGKVVIPSGILNKPGRLSEHEFAIIKLHPETAYEALRHIPFPWPVAEAVFQHHERLDGTGYPQGLKGDDIHPWARILAVADVVDAMATHRPYRAALSQQIVLKELNRAHGTVYDRQVVDVYKAMLSQKSNRVLVVDDDPGVLGVLINQLNQMNMQAEGFDDPHKALEAFKEQPFPVVITDLNMPGMSGLELTEKIKKIHLASKVIMVTGFGGKNNTVEALRAGVFDFLEKPVSIDLLSTAVNKAIRSYQGEE